MVRSMGPRLHLPFRIVAQNPDIHVTAQIELLSSKLSHAAIPMKVDESSFTYVAKLAMRSEVGGSENLGVAFGMVADGGCGASPVNWHV